MNPWLLPRLQPGTNEWKMTRRKVGDLTGPKWLPHRQRVARFDPCLSVRPLSPILLLFLVKRLRLKGKLSQL